MNKLTVRKALNKAFLKVKPNREAIDGFKNALNHLLQRINPAESEEFNKNLLSDFFKEFAFQSDYFINTNGRTDLVIHQGKNAKTPVAVMIEAKKPNKKAEMPTTKNLNAKATQELVLYYLRERITNNNLAVKHLIITDTLQWFVFDAAEFEKYFANDKKLVKQFEAFEAGKLSGKKTDFFYNNIAKAAIDKIQKEITFTHFDLNDYQKIAAAKDVEKDKKLIPLFKILSPEHLLKLKFANDSNTLDKRFYAELLHLIGLHEVGKSKKTIERLPKGKRNNGSLLENTIVQLESTNRLRKLNNRKQYGTTETEQLEAVALELVITWVNRILFLKLLEAQLLTYHKGDKSYSFLHYDSLNEYDEVSALFFQVLAKQPKDRTDFNHQNFEKVPYLNSSLFEPTELEEDTIFINALRDKFDLPLLTTTVLKDDNGKRLTGNLNTLEYLFAFLDAYDFASEGTEDIQEEQKTIINASVLGLIFEKINGYKDGSFFTPGFITMYMCRETLRRAVIQKFNEAKDWNCQTFNDLYNQIRDRKAANEIVNSLKICDPAVGSGHFLVSALNEMIAIKHDLGILQDENGRGFRDYRFQVENDELVVWDEQEDQLFQYNPTSTESSRIQKTLFHEKQTIIENCLFGVDINPNSVKICRLRLWIELLKNAYYKNKTELETLPNIDINIKCGNSLISRFKLHGYSNLILKDRKKFKRLLKDYSVDVMAYKKCTSKKQKRSIQERLDLYKKTFPNFIQTSDKEYQKILNLEHEINNPQLSLFGQDAEGWAEVYKNKKLLLDKMKADYKKNTAALYDNAFEWRFEFPEVLNDDGDFLGFDVVIGNPPYGSIFNKNEKKWLSNNYTFTDYQLDIYMSFFERGMNILNKETLLCFIVPNSWLLNLKTPNIRKLLFHHSNIIKIKAFEKPVFEEAVVDTLIVLSQKNTIDENVLEIEIETKQDNQLIKNTFNKDFLHLNYKSPVNIYLSKEALKIVSKTNQLKKLVDISSITQGTKPFQKGKGKPKQTADIVKNKPFVKNFKVDDSFRPLLRGSLINKYVTLWDNNYYISYGDWLAEPRYSANFDAAKQIAIRQTGSSFIATLDDKQFILRDNLYSIRVLNNNKEYSEEVILGLLNSKFLNWYYQNVINNEVGEALAQVKKGHLVNIPIPNYNIRFEDLITKVTKILTQKQDNPEADTSDLEREIDKLVYALYDLTAEEIAIVEKG